MNDLSNNSIILQFPFSDNPDLNSFATDQDLHLVNLENKKEGSAEINVKILTSAIKMAKEKDARMIITTNASKDRFGVAIRNSAKDNFTLLAPQQIAILVADSIQENEKSKKTLVKSVLMPELIEVFAIKKGYKIINALPGKENLLEEWENHKEEMPSMAIDKFNTIILKNNSVDENMKEVISLLLKKEKELRDENKDFLDRLIEIYCSFGFNKQKTFSVDILDNTRKRHYLSLIKTLRSKPPKHFADFKVKKVVDFEKQFSKNLITGRKTDKHLPSANILSFSLDKGGKIMIMSTEEKLYFHISMNTKMLRKEQFPEENKIANENMIKIMSSVGSLKF